MVETSDWMRGGRVVHGEPKAGEDRASAKERLASGSIDLGPLDAAVEELATRLLLTMPGCLTKTVESVRKHKLSHWDRNRESNRAWLALNMMNEGQLGFRAFHEGPRHAREADFVGLRQSLARGERWGPDLIERHLPRSQ
jgi:6-oxo-cyclohex-1-ene-carbonyl-CoA hydrolase